MSYIKHNFQDGDILTAAQLNSMDNQIYENESNINTLDNRIQELSNGMEEITDSCTKIEDMIIVEKTSNKISNESYSIGLFTLEASTHTLRGAQKTKGIFFPVSRRNGNSITVKKPYRSSVFNIATCNSQPSHGVSYTNFTSSAGETSLTIGLEESTAYIYVACYHTENDSSINFESYINDFEIYYNGENNSKTITQFDVINERIDNIQKDNYAFPPSVNLVKDIEIASLTKEGNIIKNASSTVGIIFPIEIIIGEPITISMENNTRFRIYTTVNKPAANVECEDTVTADSKHSHVLIPTKNANWMYICYATTNESSSLRDEIFDSIKVYYGTEWMENIEENTVTSLITNFTKKTGTNLKHPFLKATNKPILTIIDDDTLNIPSVTWIHDYLASRGVQCTYAVITQEIEKTANTGLIDLLKSYENQGFHMAVHCDIQQSYFQAADNSGASVENINNCYTNIANCLRKMNTYNFIDYNYWVSPYGVRGANMQKLARKFGLKCLVSITQNQFNDTTGNEGRFAIRRAGFNPTDEASTTSSLARLKESMLAASKEGGWQIIGTHSNDWVQEINNGTDENTLKARFDEVLDYADQLGFEVMTLNEAFSYRESIYRLQELC